MTDTDINIKVYANERGGKYYCYDGIMYDIHFPLAWAIGNDFDNYCNDDYPAMGPKHCGNCAFYGTIRGVFVGYCANCAHYCYELNTIFRGGIEHVPGEEIVFPTKAAFSYEELVAHYPYMKGAIIGQIGLHSYQKEDSEDDDEETHSSMPSLIQISENSICDNKMSIDELEEEEEEESLGSSQSYTDDDEEKVVGGEVVDEALIEDFEKQRIWNDFLEGIIGRKF